MQWEKCNSVPDSSSEGKDHNFPEGDSWWQPADYRCEECNFKGPASQVILVIMV